MGMTTRPYAPVPTDFKDVRGCWRTKSLFIETNDDETKYPSIFTLGPDDRDGRVSMRSVYLKSGDPTEYRAAMSIFGSYECWERLCTSPFFQSHLKQWRDELHAKIKSQAVNVVGEISVGGGSAAQLSAAKWLAQQEWTDGSPKSTNRVGRPPKEKDPTEALREALLDADEDKEDYDRIFQTSDN